MAVNPYSKEQLDKATELRRQGLNKKQISELTNVKESFLKKHFSLNKVTLTDEQQLAIRGQAAASRRKFTDTEKECSKCKQVLPLDQFSLSSNTSSGVTASCKACSSATYYNQADKVKARVREYRLANKETISLKDKEYRAANKERLLKQSYVWAKNNPDKVRDSRNKYRNKNKEYFASKCAMYRASKRNATPSWLTEEHKQQILDVYKSCPKDYEVDHIYPVNGDTVCGLHVPWNLQTLPKTQNNSKNNTAPFILNVGVCYQKTVRDSTLDTDIADGAPLNLDLQKVDLAQEHFSPEHRAFIEKYEWLGTVGYTPKWVFTARYEGKLAGVVILAEPNGYSFAKEREALIQRGACSSWAPKNLNSKLVMFSVRWMVQNTNKRVFMAYSDFEAGEVGTIYQACNFDYVGNWYGAKVKYNYNGKEINGRYFTKTHMMKKWAKELNIEWQSEWLKPNGYQDLNKIPKDILLALKAKATEEKSKCTIQQVQPKGKYLLILGQNKKETYELKKEFAHSYKPLPYPKRSATLE